MKDSKVLLIYTGGTIGMKENPLKNTLEPLDFNHITKELPELNKMDCKIDTVSFEDPIDSSDIDCEIWEEIGDIIYSNYNEYDGFVVLHGTDTMSYTACALSFMFENLKKPIILTGSQLPIGMVRTDGKENLITSIEIASAKKNKKSIIQEVAIYFEFHLHRGNRTSKVSSEHFDAFISYNYPNLAEIGVEIKYNYPNLLRKDCNQLIYKKGFSPEVLVVFFYPGIQFKKVIQSIQKSNLKVVILFTFGSGNLPKNKDFISFINDQKNNLIFLNVSQCAAGYVEQNNYSNGANLKNAGVIGVRDLTIEAAIVKSMFLINKYPNDFQKFIEFFNKDLAGEFT